MYGTLTLTGRNTTPSGRAHAGQVIVTANTTIRDTAGNVVMSGSEAVTLDETGAWSLVLPCDSPELNPSTGIGYRVGYELRAATMQSQSFYATADMAGSTLDVSKIVSVSLPTPLSAIVGPAGPSTPEATADVAGKVRLTGDLGGTADAPTVPALASKVELADPRLTDARTPLTHTHPTSQVTGLDSALAGKVGNDDARLSDARTPLAHSHPTAQVVGLDTALSGKVDATDGRLFDARTPLAHGHVVSDVTGLADTLTTFITATAGDARWQRSLGVFTPEQFGAVGNGTADDSAAIQSAVNAASDAGAGTVVHFRNKTYAVASKLTLPAASPVHLRMASGGSIVATAAMTSVIEKPAGTSTGVILENLTVDGAGLADRALDILQSNTLRVVGGVYKNALVAAVDIGRTSLQNYEIEWSGGKIIGRDNGATTSPTDRPAYALRIGSGCTDNQFVDIKVKNALTLVYCNGQNNAFTGVHPYGYPYKSATQTQDWNAGAVQFDVPGTGNRFIGCVADSAEIGFRLGGTLNTLVGCECLWPTDSTPTNPVTGIVVNGPSSIITGCAFYNPGGVGSANGITFGASAFRPVVMGNQFVGTFSGGYVGSIAALGGRRTGNFSDIAGAIDEQTNAKFGQALNLNLGNANDVLLQWAGTNPGRMIALGTGATGFVRLDMTTAGGGWQVGATGSKVGFMGATPVVRATALAAATDATTTQSLVNDLRSKLIALGLIA